MFRCKSTRSHGKWCFYLADLPTGYVRMRLVGVLLRRFTLTHADLQRRRKSLWEKQKIKPFIQSIHNIKEVLEMLEDQRPLGLLLYATQVAIHGCTTGVAVQVLEVRIRILASFRFSDTQTFPQLHPQSKTLVQKCV